MQYGGQMVVRPYISQKVLNFVNFSATRSIFPSKTIAKIVSEYDQEIPQSQTADYSMAPRGRAAQPSRDTRKTN